MAWVTHKCCDKIANFVQKWGRDGPSTNAMQDELLAMFEDEAGRQRRHVFRKAGRSCWKFLRKIANKPCNQ
jgi:hypothetical protein